MKTHEFACMNNDRMKGKNIYIFDSFALDAEQWSAELGTHKLFHFFNYLLASFLAHCFDWLILRWLRFGLAHLVIGSFCDRLIL